MNPSHQPFRMFRFLIKKIVKLARKNESSRNFSLNVPIFLYHEDSQYKETLYFYKNFLSTNIHNISFVNFPMAPHNRKL